MAVDYSQFKAIMLPENKRDASGVDVTYTYRTNFNDWVLNTERNHEIEISDDGSTLTIKKFNPHFWIIRTPDLYTQEEFTTAWKNWKVNISGIENAITQMSNEGWMVYPAAGTTSSQCVLGLVASQLLESGKGWSMHKEFWWMDTWDGGIYGGAFKYPNPGSAAFGYRNDGNFNIFDGNVLDYSQFWGGFNNASYCALGVYGVNNYVTEAPETYVNSVTVSGTTYYEPVTDLIDVSDNPIIIKLLPVSYSTTSTASINYQKEIWDSYKNDSSVWHKDMTVENCLLKYDGTQVEDSDTVVGRIDVGSDASTLSSPKFLDDGLADTARGLPWYAILYRYDEINHTAHPDWVGDAYYQYNTNAPYQLPESGRITDLKLYNPYNLCFVGSGEVNGNIGYLDWLNEYYASENSPFVEHSYDLTNSSDLAEVTAVIEAAEAANTNAFGYLPIEKPMVNRLYLDNDADHPLVINVDFPYYQRGTDNAIEEYTYGRTFGLEGNKEGRLSHEFCQGCKKVNNIIINWKRGCNQVPQHLFANVRNTVGNITFNYMGKDPDGNDLTAPTAYFGLAPTELDNTFCAWPYTTLNLNGSTTEVPTCTYEGTDFMYWKNIEHTQWAFDGASKLKVIDVRTSDDDEVTWTYGTSAANEVMTDGDTYTEEWYREVDAEGNVTIHYKPRWPFPSTWERSCMAQMCCNCSNLTSIKPILDVHNIWYEKHVHGDSGITWQHAFLNCDNLSEIYLKGINYFNWDLSPLKSISTASLTYMFDNATDLTTTIYDTNYLVPTASQQITGNYDWKHKTTSTYTDQGYLKVTFPSEAQTALDAVDSTVKSNFRAKGWKIYVGTIEYTA